MAGPAGGQAANPNRSRLAGPAAVVRELYRRHGVLANLLWGPVMVGVGYLFGVQAARLQGPWRWAGPAVTGAVLLLAFWRLRTIGADLARAAKAPADPGSGSSGQRRA